MKTIHLNLFLFLLLNASVGAFCQEEKSQRKLDIPTSREEIVLLDSTINLYKAGDFFISGQPNDSIISALKNQGLELIINVRTHEEMAIIKENGFDEEAFSDSLNIPYVNIPIGGDAGFTQKAINDINDAIQLHDGNVMIHCRAAGRATNAWIAWLTNYYNVSLDDAIILGKQMQFKLYLEDLLGYELSYREK
jgi:protein tyrosine phosphatase (PTP) superfamily phosphohydrolase (DUF442 family)